MKRLLIFVGVAIAAAAAGGLAWSANRGDFAAIDRCLASNGMWNDRLRRCDPAPIGPVDRILVDKSDHLMWVFRDGHELRKFRVALGKGGLAPKVKQGDGRVPEGRYTIAAHNPASAYHLSLRVGYPTAAQVAAARKAEIDPGGDIMIHGLPPAVRSIGSRHILVDWTAGCIGVTDREMDWLFEAVADGTPIEIRA